MKKQYIFFDFDGTLVDTSEGIFYSLAYALECMGETAMSEQDMRRFIGPPLEWSFVTYNNMSKQDADKATEHFRKVYKIDGVNMHKVYDGVIETLKELKSRGKKLIIATSKPEPLAVQIMKDNGFYDYFDVISGATFDGKRSTKEQVLNYALSLAKPDSLSDCVLVGDSKSDAVGANAVGMDFVGVLYGFGARKDLKIDNTKALIEKLTDLLKIID